MAKMATVILLLITAAAGASAQSEAEVGSGAFAVRGFVISRDSSFNDEFEVRLFSADNIALELLRTHPEQSFTFHVPKRGTYYVELEISGFKKVHERVDLESGDKEANLPIILEKEQVIDPKPRKVLGDEVAVSAAEIASDAKFQKRFQDADKKLQEGDLKGALSRLESLTRDAPGFYDGHRALGEVYQKTGRYSEAEKEYETARDLRPANAAPLVLLGGLYLLQIETAEPASLVQDHLEKAGQALRRAVELDPQIAFAHYLLGVAYYKAGRFSDAEKSLTNALELDPQLGPIRLALANLYTRVQNFPAALAQLDAYLKENPRAPDRDRVIEARREIEQRNAAGKAARDLPAY